MAIEYYKLLKNNPIKINDYLTLYPPTLEKVFEIYDMYQIYLFYMSANLDQYLKLNKLEDAYDKLTEKQKNDTTFYNLITSNEIETDLFLNLFSFFIVDNIEFNSDLNSFVVWKLCERTEKKLLKREKHIQYKDIIGYIDKNNFDEIRACICQLNHLSCGTDKAVKYKNDRAKKIAEKIAKGLEEQNKKNNLNLDLSKMISKYCADNKNGINIDNVWKLTIYQFYDQFEQHNHIRQASIQDNIYTNTVSFSDLKMYDQSLWLK